MDAISLKHPDGCFDMVFADPPYFLSNGGITCYAGKMVKVDKGTWDKSQGLELNHEFNIEWLRRCQKLLKPNGTLWVSGIMHAIFSIGFAMQQLGFKILNNVIWRKHFFGLYKSILSMYFMNQEGLYDLERFCLFTRCKFMRPAREAHVYTPTTLADLPE